VRGPAGLQSLLPSSTRLGFQRLGSSGGSYGPQILRRVQHRAHTLDADFSKNLPWPASTEPLKRQILKSLKNRNSPTGTPRCGCSASSTWGDMLQVSPNPAPNCTDMPFGEAGRDELVFSRVFQAAEPEKGNGTAPGILKLRAGRAHPGFCGSGGAGTRDPEIWVSAAPFLLRHQHMQACTAPASRSFSLAGVCYEQRAPDAFWPCPGPHLPNSGTPKPLIILSSFPIRKLP